MSSIPKMQQLLRVKLQPRHCSCRAVDGRREVRDPTGVDCWGSACECQVLSAQSSPRMGGVGWSTPTSRACFLKEARVRDGETAQGPRPLAALSGEPRISRFPARRWGLPVIYVFSPQGMRHPLLVSVDTRLSCGAHAYTQAKILLPIK